jgi:accessory gene regulator B
MNSLIERLFNALLIRNVVRPEQKDIIFYGLDLLLSNVISLLVLLLGGTILGRFMDTAFYLIAYIPLQSFGGGYHANTHLRCFLLTAFLVGSSLWLMRAISQYWLFIASLAGSIVIFIIAPVEHPNAPFSVAFGLRMRRIVRKVDVFLFACCILPLGIRSPIIAPVSVAIGASGISLLCAYISAKKKSYRQTL